MWRWLLVVAVLGLAGCAQQVERAQATSITRFDVNGRLWTCQIDLGMTGQEMIEQCGPPFAALPFSPFYGVEVLSAEVCIAYDDAAQSLSADNLDTPAIIVCLGPPGTQVERSVDLKEPSVETEKATVEGWSRLEPDSQIAAGVIVAVHHLRALRLGRVIK